MAQITIEELYRGDEYNVMGNAVAELMTESKAEDVFRGQRFTQDFLPTISVKNQSRHS